MQARARSQVSVSTTLFIAACKADGDTADLLAHGVPAWAVAAPGFLAIPLGLLRWNRLGPHFGLRGEPIDRLALVASATALATLLIAMLAWSRWA
jgi:hypothetical protein